jgi:hypothetical protein
MTRSKIELATILTKLRGDDSDPVQLAKEMSLMKLCYEIQKVEEEREAETPEVDPKDAPKEEEAPKEDAPEELTEKEQKIVEELKVPEKASTEKRHKHILSWLLDSSSDEES